MHFVDAMEAVDDRRRRVFEQVDNIVGVK